MLCSAARGRLTIGRRMPSCPTTVCELAIRLVRQLVPTITCRPHRPLQPARARLRKCRGDKAQTTLAPAQPSQRRKHECESRTQGRNQAAPSCRLDARRCRLGFSLHIQPVRTERRGTYAGAHAGPPHPMPRPRQAGRPGFSSAPRRHNRGQGKKACGRRSPARYQRK